MDDERIDHGRENPPPSVAKHDGGGIDNPAVMCGVAYGFIHWTGYVGD